MEFRFAYLANAAEVGPDGRFFVLGGGIDILGVPKLPERHPYLSVVFRVHFNEEELAGDHSPHDFSLTITRPDGTESEPLMTRSLLLKPMPLFSDLGLNVDLAFSFTGMPFIQEGVHVLNIQVDGRKVGASPFGVTIDRDSGQDE